jgi:biopolymer transport protein ExbB
MDSSIIIFLFDSIPLWVTLLPILVCSVVLLAVFLERIVFYKSISLDFRSLLSGIKIEGGQIKDLKLPEKKNNPLVEMLKNISREWSNSYDKSSLVQNYSLKAVSPIEKYVSVVSTIATISPMFGLLGTVTGMMRSFSGLARYGPSVQTQLAQGITEALITTAMGLVVAIPALIFYNYMVAKVNYLVKEVEYLAAYFLKFDPNNN